MAMFESGEFEQTVGECERVHSQTHGPGRDVIFPDSQRAEYNLGTGVQLQSARLILGQVGLGEPGEMIHDHQDILIPPRLGSSCK